VKIFGDNAGVPSRHRPAGLVVLGQHRRLQHTVGSD
jgi:hypothetical protein